MLSIVRDVTEPKRAIELNRALAGRMIVSQEEERQRIARELHDDLSQKIACSISRSISSPASCDATGNAPA